MTSTGPKTSLQDTFIFAFTRSSTAGPSTLPRRGPRWSARAPRLRASSIHDVDPVRRPSSIMGPITVAGIQWIPAP